MKEEERAEQEKAIQWPQLTQSDEELPDLVVEERKYDDGYAANQEELAEVQHYLWNAQFE